MCIRDRYRKVGHHEAIISRDDFIAVQKLITNAKYGNKEILPELHVIQEGSLSAVSYTHLDVYKRKPVHRVQMTEGKRNIIHQLLEEYDIQSAEDIQDALKDLLGGTIKEMMEAEMDDHLGYEKSERSDSDDSRNGYKRKRVNSRYGSMEIEVHKTENQPLNLK